MLCVEYNTNYSIYYTIVLSSQQKPLEYSHIEQFLQEYATIAGPDKMDCLYKLCGTFGSVLSTIFLFARVNLAIVFCILHPY